MTSAYRFGPFEIQPIERRLLVDGRPATLGPRAFDVLLALAERAGQLVSKNELLDLVWAGRVVEDNNLQVQISALRKLLGPDVIATIPGRGYRLTLAPSEQSASHESSTGAPTSVATPVDIPGETLPLYGRVDDLAALHDLVRSHGLVTVVGPAGIGKTRLAQAVAHELHDTFPDGVKFAELASLADPTLVAVTVARALGLVGGDARAGLALDAHAMAGRGMLLVLDNCEHLLDAVVPVVAALRKDAPGVHILATSQEYLRHPEEHVYRLGALALPVAATVPMAREAGAIELFVARAQAVEPRFLLGDDNVGAVVEISRRLDGIPLAIELAAARIPLLGVEGIRERLDERFRLLTAGSRVALRRHQTLRAALEWSYGLLSPPEQAVFDKLGVFAGSFSLESAQALAADDSVDEWDVLDHLGALVDKSLVNVEGANITRYRMLETTRAFALERLAARGATLPTMRRHARVMLELFERHYDEVLHGTPSIRVVTRIAPDLDNLRGALQWAGDVGGDRRIAIALFGAAVAGHGYFFYAPLKVRHWIDQLRPLVDASMPASDAARFWLACADWGAIHSPLAAIEDARRAIALYRDLDDRLGTCRGWTTLTYSLMAAGRLPEVRHALDEMIRSCDPAWPPWLRALVDNMATLALLSLGELREARRHALAFLEACQKVSGDVDECVARTILVELDVAAGHVREAATEATAILSRYPALWKDTEDGKGLRSLATALMCADRLDEAEPLYREALSRVKRNYGSATLLIYDLAMFLALRERIDDAARVFACAEALHADEGVVPRLVGRQMRDRLRGLLAERLAPDVLSRLYEEGRRLTDDEACALALPG